VPVLKQIFDREAEETITDEQLRRVLAPALRYIESGALDQKKRRRADWYMKPLAMVAVVAMVFLGVLMFPGAAEFGRAASVVPAEGDTAEGDTVTLPDTQLPLAGWVEPVTVSGRVFLQDSGDGVAGAQLALVDTDGVEAAAATTDEDGAYVFRGIPDGTYRLRADLPKGMAATGEDEWITVKDKAVFAPGGSGERKTEGVDISVCITE
jgi:hypothetical protein